MNDERKNEALLTIRDLHVHYVTDGEVVKAINGINLTVNRGQVLGLVGETGAGKTTTALSILRLLPKYVGKVPKGEIIFDGIDVLKAKEDVLRDMRGHRISMIFQDPMTSLNPVFTVENQIAEVIKLHNKHLTKAEVTERVERTLEYVGIPASRKTEYPHQFSGGMKQRVMIAIAVSCNPELLIADEPTTALDVTIQAQVMKMMKDLQKELNSSVILITHDLGIVANFCDSVAVMYAGEIVETGTLEDIFDRDKPHHPYTKGLFNSIPSLKNNVSRLQSIPGLMPDPADLPTGCKFHPRCSYCTDACKSGAVARYENGTHQIMCNLYQEKEVSGDE